MTGKENKIVRTNKGIREHTFLGCPLTRHRSAWCFRLCAPNEEGTGQCGRVAPHGLQGRTALAIEKHQARQAQYESLERTYLAAPYNALHEPGIRVGDGEADIVIPLEERLAHATGRLDTVILKAMNDSAACAIHSLVGDQVVSTASFSVSLTGTTPVGELIARGRFVGMTGENYLAETMLTDADGAEIGRGEGAFILRS